VVERHGWVPGVADLRLVGGVVLLRLDEQVAAAMLEGWRAHPSAGPLALAEVTSFQAPGDLQTGQALCLVEQADELLRRSVLPEDQANYDRPMDVAARFGFQSVEEA
jgi:hypothetical protein